MSEYAGILGTLSESWGVGCVLAEQPAEEDAERADMCKGIDSAMRSNFVQGRDRLRNMVTVAVYAPL